MFPGCISSLYCAWSAVRSSRTAYDGPSQSSPGISVSIETKSAARAASVVFRALFLIGSVQSQLRSFFKSSSLRLISGGERFWRRCDWTAALYYVPAIAARVDVASTAKGVDRQARRKLGPAPLVERFRFLAHGPGRRDRYPVRYGYPVRLSDPGRPSM
jgi:hypothetical protein